MVKCGTQLGEGALALLAIRQDSPTDEEFGFDLVFLGWARGCDFVLGTFAEGR